MWTQLIRNTKVAKNPSRNITPFDFKPGRFLLNKYQVIDKLGSGWEGEVYRVSETATGIERAAKFFYPQRNPGNRAFKFYAKKLHKLRHCEILIQYHTQEVMRHGGLPVPFLISEYVDGDLLSAFIAKQPGGRLTAFQGMHLLHAMAKGIEEIHRQREYHGDLHTDNFIIQRYGLGFDLKLFDLIQWKAPRPENIQSDVCELIRMFYDSIGGEKFYHKQPKEVKSIVCGLKRTLILDKFKTAGHIRQYLETLKWER